MSFIWFLVGGARYLKYTWRGITTQEFQQVARQPNDKPRPCDGCRGDPGGKLPRTRDCAEWIRTGPGTFEPARRRRQRVSRSCQRLRPAPEERRRRSSEADAARRYVQARGP